MHGRDEECIQSFGQKNLKRGNNLENMDMDGKILEWILGKQGRMIWTGCIWLRTGTSERLL
jgi:hypothetical protein